MSSTFEVPVIKVTLEPHPNADTLSIVRYLGYQIVVKTEEFKNGQLAVYVPPDSVVPQRQEWDFLGMESRHRRIRTRKFRGVWSQGLLTNAPEGLRVGSNAASALGIIPYEPPSSSREGMSSRQLRALPWYHRIFAYWRELEGRPRGRYPYYDIENGRRYPEIFLPGEPIIVTEKVHGANGLYTSRKPWYRKTPQIFMRSRTLWKKRGKSDWWQNAFQVNLSIERILSAIPGISIYGEVYGRGVQALEYGLTSPNFVAFDIWKDNNWMPQEDALDLLKMHKVPTVPILYIGPFVSFEWIIKNLNGPWKMSKLAERNGTVQISEGIVVQSQQTRKIMKFLSDGYLEKAS